MIREAVILMALIGALMLCRTVRADVVEYNTADREQWFTDVGGTENVSTVDFTGFDDLTVVDDQWAHLGVHFSGVVVTSGPGCVVYPNDCWGIEGYPDINVTFDEPINWIAADFPGDVRIELFRDDQLIYTSNILGSAGTGLFGGLISDEPFDAARFFTGPPAHVKVLDDLHFGPVIAVPAPGGLIVLCSAALVTRRRRSS